MVPASYLETTINMFVKALKHRETECFFERKRKRRKEARREGKGKEGLDASLPVKVPKSFEQDQKCRSFLHLICLSLEQRPGPQAPGLQGEASPLGKIWHREVLVLLSLAS